MSIFKVKDLDVKLAELLTDKDLESLNRVSKYFLRIFDEAFYKRRFYIFLKTLPKHSILPEMNVYNEPWKKFYNLTKCALQHDKHSRKIEKAIEEDRSDILSLIFRNYEHKDNSIYDWDDRTKDWIDPIQLTISKDSARCYAYLLQFSIGYYPNSVFKNHSHKIIHSKNFQEILSLKERINAIIYSFENGCEKCYSALYTPDLQDKVIDELYDTDVVSLLPLLDLTASSPFSVFMDSIPYDDILKYKEVAIYRDRFYLIKLFTIYSSYFR